LLVVVQVQWTGGSSCQAEYDYKRNFPKAIYTEMLITIFTKYTDRLNKDSPTHCR